MVFEKISYERWETDWKKYVCHSNDMLFDDYQCKQAYDNINLPERSTTMSAGYDFSIPYSCNGVNTGDFLMTGIRWRALNEDEEDLELEQLPVLFLFARSGMAAKTGLRLINSVGVVDADYYQSVNEGHILMVAECAYNKPVTLQAGTNICQGVIMKAFTTTPDNVRARQRTGGFGSTGITK